MIDECGADDIELPNNEEKMGDGYNFTTLKSRILALSQAGDWETAKKEWVLVEVYEADQPETCLCDHTPIIEICTIKNRLSGSTADVGNVCVKRFLGIRSDLIFAALKRIRKDAHRALNDDAIVFFRDKGLINSWEYNFLQDTKSKRNLSFKQMTKRIDINQRVLESVARRGLPS